MLAGKDAAVKQTADGRRAAAGQKNASRLRQFFAGFLPAELFQQPAAQHQDDALPKIAEHQSEHHDIGNGRQRRGIQLV